MAHREGPREGQRIEDIVRASGVSRSTVFRYFAGNPVRPQAVAAIERALAVLQTPVPTPLSAKREYLVSVVPTYARFRGYAEVLDGVLQRSHETGAGVRIGSWQDGDPQPGGVIILGKGMADEDVESLAWRSRGVPCVLINRIPEELDRSWVSADCRTAAREAVEHLFAQGCRRVVAWCDEGSRVSRDKLRGYRDALLAAGMDPDPGLRFDPAAASLESVFASLMDRHEPPDGWFSPDDESAAQVISLAAARGIAVPQNLAVVGMNDSTVAPHMVPSLTSVRLPFHEMGLAAVDTLDRLVSHPRERSIRIVLAHQLVVRDSSRRI